MQATKIAGANPFPYLLVDSFLPAAILKRVEEKLVSRETGQSHPAGYTFDAWFDADLVRYLYQFVRQTVGPQFGATYGFSPIYKLPQIYRIQGPWKGLAPHTDNQAGRDLAMIIYLSRYWQKESGGELQLLDNNQRPWQTVEPIFNRAVFFPLGESSWHAVRPIHDDFERVTLIQDWAL